MSNEKQAIEVFGLACGAVANAIDEEGLSIDEAVERLANMLVHGKQPEAVRWALGKFRRAENEFELWLQLCEEASRVLDVVRRDREAWPSSLFTEKRPR